MQANIFRNLKFYFFQQHKEFVFFIGFLIYSFIIMFFCTMSSPLYYTNTWNDVNIYFTMGKGLFNGKVPYRDLFDHKGPLLYFIYGIGYLISNNSFFGIYILESLSLAFSLFFIYKIVHLFTKEKFSLLIIFIYPAVLLNSKIFRYGGSVEEFMLPFIFIGLFYSLLIFFNNSSTFNFKSNFIMGYCTAAIILLKINIIIIFFPFLAVAFFMLLKTKKYKTFSLNIAGYTFGLFVILFPFLFYFLRTNSLFDAYKGYIKFNTLYADMNLNIGTVMTFIKTIISVIYKNYTVSIIIFFGIAVFAFRNNYMNIQGRFCLVFSFILLLFMIYGTGRSYRYNYIPVTVFIIFAFIILIELFHSYKKNKLYIILLAILMIPLNTNIRYSRLFSDEPIVLKFSRIIKEYNNPDIINYHTLDLGIQNVIGIIPSQKYFYLPNIPYEVFPEIINEQNEIVRTKKVSFIITKGELNELLTSNYEIVNTATDSNGTFTLLKRKTVL